MDKPYTYLKDKYYYSELYDKLTIEECKRWENKKITNSDNDPKIKIKNEFLNNTVTQLSLYFIKGTRYANKELTIQKWMQRDQALDEKIASAQEPKNIRCLICSLPMNCISKDLHNHNNEDEVLFMFECSKKSHKRRAFWGNGQEWEPPATLCPNCNVAMSQKHIKKNNIITITYNCPKCKHKETITLDLNEKDKEIDQNFETDRKKYCLSEKDGEEYISSLYQSEHALNSIKEREENKEIYQAVAKIKTLAIIDLQNLLNPLLEQANYSKIELSKPEIKKDLFLEFTIEDNKPGRAEYKSRLGLQKLLKQALEGTNWRLMSEGVSYKLGILSGRLRGVSGEENLKDLISEN